MSIQIGTCDLCGQELLLTEDDCWHPYNVDKACPPEPDGSFATNFAAWDDWYNRAGNRSGRPGREHFVSTEARQ